MSEHFDNVEEEAMNSVERLLTALDLKETDRVPVWPSIDFLPANYTDITMEEMIMDPDKAQKAYKWIYNKLGGYDIVMPGGGSFMQFFNSFPDFFSGFYLDWRLPGRQLEVNQSPQLYEHSHQEGVITSEDYDRIVEEGMLWLANFKRAKLRDLMKTPKIAEKVAENTREWWEDYKVPTFTDSACSPPFELLSMFRGSTNFMKDIYRHPDKIKKASEFLVDGLTAMAEYGPSQSGGKTILIGAVRSSADFISRTHFEEFVLPYLKKMVSRILDDGFIVQLHFDTGWTDRLDLLKELPKGKIYLHMDERTDIVKAKEILGDHMCIEGNIKPSLFTLGTPKQIEKETKAIIDACAEGGGLMVGSEIPDDAKLENIKAMIDTCKEYGQYRK
jgi:uroporphyrinogen-III decarboxylase